MQLNNLKIWQRLCAAFGIVILLMLAVTVISFVQVTHLNAEVERMVHAVYPKTVMAVAVKDALNDTSRSVRNLLFLSVASEIRVESDVIAQAGRRIDGTLAQLRQQAVSEDDKALLANVVEAQAAFAQSLDAFLKLVAAGEIEQARDLSLPALVPFQKRYFDSLDRLIAHEGVQMDRAARRAESLSAATRLLVTTIALAAALLAMVVGWWVTRGITLPLDRAVAVARRVAAGDLTAEIGAAGRDETGQLLHALANMNSSLADTVRQVRSGTETIAESSSEMAVGNADLSMRTERQSASLENTASAMEQITMNVRNNADNARHASELAGIASERAAHGGKVVSEVVQTMSSIQESARRIVDIIAVIDDIAFQTNILALNAAVEAARAGEQGRGFAVVAAEVRSLAQRSAGAAKEIKGLIGDSAEKIDEGGRLVDQAGGAMQDIVASVAQVATILGEITVASSYQSGGIEAINQAIAQMDEMTRQNAALVEQAAAAADAVRAQAASLGRSVSVFRLEDGSASGSEQTDPAAALRPALTLLARAR